MSQKTVYRARNTSEAAIVKTLLQDAGIESLLVNDSLQGALGDLPLGQAMSPQLLVSETDYEAARKVIEQYEADLAAHPDESHITDEIGQFDWPLCPDCDELRQMRCPHCGYEGAEFMLDPDSDIMPYDAETIQTSGEGVLLGVICNQCQHPAKLAFQGVCRYCQHDFATDKPGGQSSEPGHPDISAARSIFLIGGLAVVVIVLVLLFFLAVR